MNYSNVKNFDSVNMRESNKQCHVKGLNNEMDAYIERAQVSMGPYKHVIMQYPDQPRSGHQKFNICYQKYYIWPCKYQFVKKRQQNLNEELLREKVKKLRAF